MIRQIEFWEDRDRNAGADLETSVTMADTSEEHAAMLSVHVHQPYFGNLKVRVGGREQTLYIGKHAFLDTRGGHSVVSWESEVGSLFYSDALGWTPRRGGKGVIRRRRQLPWPRGAAAPAPTACAPPSPIRWSACCPPPTAHMTSPRWSRRPA